MDPVEKGSRGGSKKKKREEEGQEEEQKEEKEETEEKEEEEAKFIAAFYATPLGLGRTRLFIRYARSVAPSIRVPRPLLAMGLNGFLDSDTLTVASQALRVARAEAAAALARERKIITGGDDDGENDDENDKKINSNNNLSRSLFLFRSPTESFLSAVTSWLDEALPSAPGRDAASLASLVARLEGSDAADGKGGLPRREKVLDRFRGHTSIVPSSMRFYRACKEVAEVGKGVATVFAAAAVAVGAGEADLSSSSLASSASSSSLLPLLLATGGIAALASVAASDLASRFEYRYTRERQAKDLEKIAVLAPEVERATSDERF